MKRVLKIIIEYAISVFVLTGLLFVIYRSSGSIQWIDNISRERLLILIRIICAVLLVIMRLLIRYMADIRYLNSSLSRIDKMSGEEFEVYLKTFFEKKGYTVELTPLSNDYGADLVCSKKEEVIVVQAKRYEGNVGNSAVQEIVAAKEYYEADRCIVVTNSYFTKNAVGLAEANDVELWDRDVVRNMKYI